MNYRDKYVRKKNAYIHLKKDYDNLKNDYDNFKEIIIKELEKLKSWDYGDYDCGYNTGVEHCIAVIADMTKPVIWLTEAEEKEVNKSKLEFELLNYWRNKGYKWIARDEDDTLCIFKNKPVKFDKAFANVYDYHLVDECRELFQYVEWEDEEPTEIEDLIRYGSDRHD